MLYECLIAKVEFNPDLGKKLIDTMGSHIYEDSPTDDIWGWRYEQDHSGKNLLGECWMEIRDLVISEIPLTGL